MGRTSLVNATARSGAGWFLPTAIGGSDAEQGESDRAETTIPDRRRLRLMGAPRGGNRTERTGGMSEGTRTATRTRSACIYCGRTGPSVQGSPCRFAFPERTGQSLSPSSRCRLGSLYNTRSTNRLPRVDCPDRLDARVPPLQEMVVNDEDDVPCIADPGVHDCRLARVGVSRRDPRQGHQSRGRRTAPLRTIQRAAELAQPGDMITVHAGIYRERISPPRGGDVGPEPHHLPGRAGREQVEIRGSEVVKNWVKVQGDVWKVTLPNSFFGTLQPLQRPASTATGSTPEAASITPAPSISTATG